MLEALFYAHPDDQLANLGHESQGTCLLECVGGLSTDDIPEVYGIQFERSGLRSMSNRDTRGILGYSSKNSTPQYTHVRSRPETPCHIVPLGCL